MLAEDDKISSASHESVKSVAGSALTQKKGKH
jgi:hypothetical protein